MSTLDEDWLAAGPIIEQRLRDQVRELRLVAGINDLGELESRVGQQDPAAFVVYDGDRIAPQVGSGASEAGAQCWIVVLAVRSSRAGGDGSGLRSEAGRLLPLVRDTLRGWAPFDGGRPLRRVTAPRPGYSAVFAYLPLAFELDFVTAPPRR